MKKIPQGQTFAVVHHPLHIWDLAAAAAESAAKEKMEDPARHTPAALTAIVMSAVAAEGFINEFGNVLLNAEWLQFGAMKQGTAEWARAGAVLELAEEGNAQTVTKYRMASLLMGKPLDPGESPLQEFCELVRLRNDIVHAKPRVAMTGRANPVKLPGYLRRFVALGWTRDGFVEGEAANDWLVQVETPQMARWACRASRDLVLEMAWLLASGDGVMVKFLSEQLQRSWEQFRDDPRVEEPKPARQPRKKP